MIKWDLVQQRLHTHGLSFQKQHPKTRDALKRY